MGSGKSTVGKRLATLKSYQFIDLDNYIETSEGINIRAIFETKGEIYFRRIEHRYLKEILGKEENLVLATGGGTPCYGSNMEVILQATSQTYYLKLSISTIVERLIGEKEERPLVKDIPDDELPEFIAKHLFERSFFYNQSHHVITCDTKDPVVLAEEIANSSS